ncbi:uncharacterized protein BT62DRAFT_891833, partial [Guyanagaster necrorhizus]
TDNKYKNIEKVFLAIIAGYADEEMAKCIRAVVNFIYYTYYKEYTTELLKKLEDLWYTFYKYKIFIDQRICDYFNILKIHFIHHYTSMIYSHGSTGGVMILAPKSCLAALACDLIRN